MADPLKGIDLDALDREFGGKMSKSNRQIPDALKNIDLDALDREFGGIIEPEKEKPKQEWWQGLKDDPNWSGLVGNLAPEAGLTKRIGVGLLRGGKDVLDTGAHGLARVTSAIGDAILPESLAGPIRKSKDEVLAADKADNEQFEKEYGDTTSVGLGRLGGQIAATAPLMPTKLIQGVNAVTGALPTISVTGARMAAPLVNRLRAAIGTGGIGGATLGAATSSTNDSSLGENIGEGLVSGAIGGPLVAGASQAGKSLGSKLVGKISNSRAELAKRAEELGINLKATQVSTSPLLKKYDQMSGILPFSGARDVSDSQVGQINRAISRTFGQDTEELSPKLVKDSLKNIGQGMEKVYKSTATNADANLANDLQKVRDNSKLFSDDEERTVAKHLTNVLKQIKGGTIDGEEFHNLTKYNAPLSKMQKAANPNLASAANEIRSALENAFKRSAHSDTVKELQKLKLQYKSAKTVEPLIEADANGDVSPLKLMRKVLSSPGGKLGSGELGEIADIGRAFFPTPADSGTPTGMMVLNALHSPLSAGGVGLGAMLHGSAMTDIAAGGGGLVANRLMREAVNSKAVRNAIIRGGTGETHGIVNKLTDMIIPYTSEATKNKDNNRLRITVYPKY